MRQRGYVIAFVVILLLACVGGFFGGRYLLERMRQDFAPRAGWTPPVATAVAEAPLPVALTVAPDTGPTAAPRPTATVLIVPTPTGVPVLPATSPAAVPGTPEAIVTETETPSPTPPPSPAATFPYALARPVRPSTGDCPGMPGLVYVLGQVIDRAGTPLPDVRLKLVDEYGNVAFAVSKSNPGDLGRYDFPVTGPARRLYLRVVDGAERPLSAEVEIPYGLPPTADATCHWVDWRRQF
ncbi:MAG: hypothetical protein ACUVS6_02865 [Anaerolineae bacterium]